MGEFCVTLGIFLVKTLVLHTFWTIITVDLVWVSLSGKEMSFELQSANFFGPLVTLQNPKKGCTIPPKLRQNGIK